MASALILLGAVAAGWFIQILVTARQAQSFNRLVVQQRATGPTAVGAGGRPYRGGRAYVVLSLGEDRRVQSAYSLEGWTTFARPKPLPALVGVRESTLRGTGDIAALSPRQRDAARQAARAVPQATQANQPHATPTR